MTPKLGHGGAGSKLILCQVTGRLTCIECQYYLSDGVLLLVGMLKELGVLAYFPHLYDVMPPLAANYVMGLVSSLFDNVPLTAALLNSGIEMTLPQWLTLTYAVGVGGSLLVIGSAAGVVAMSKVESLTFGSYLKYSGYLLVAYSVGFAGVLGVSALL